MFVDEIRALLEARHAGRQPLLEAWRETRLAFLAGRLGADAMAGASAALRMADGDRGLLEQVEEALLADHADSGLAARLFALHQELALAQGDGELILQAARAQARAEACWLRPPGAVFGKRLGRRELNAVLALSSLREERAPAFEELCAPGVASAADALAALRACDELARQGGWSRLLDVEASRLGLDPQQPERWLEALRGLAPAIRDAVGRREGGLSPAGGSVDSVRRGALYPSGSPGRDGRPLPGWLAALAARPPLELLQDAAGCLGLEVDEVVAAWNWRADLPPALQGLLAGQEGAWPVALLDPQGDPWGGRRSLRELGRALGAQTGAVGLRAAGEEWVQVSPCRRLQAETLGVLLERLPFAPGVATRLLEDLPEDAEASWREQDLLELGEDLLRLEWLCDLPVDEAAAGRRWLEVRETWLGLPAHAGEASLWAADPLLSLKGSDALLRVAARLASAGLRQRWLVQAAEGSPEWGGLLLETLTEPDDPDLWEDCAERVLEALDPASLAASLGLAVPGPASGEEEDGPELA